MLPQRILDQFARIPYDTAIKNKYYGVYDKILNTVCFTDDTFTIEPQYPLPWALSGPNIDFVVTYVVNDNGTHDLPIFFIEINPSLHIDYISSRIDADAQTRARFRALYDANPTWPWVPMLHGVSIMGHRLAFYCMDIATGRVHPEYVAPSMEGGVDTVPAGRWETDITTKEGYERFMAVINDVKEMAAAL